MDHLENIAAPSKDQSVDALSATKYKENSRDESSYEFDNAAETKQNMKQTRHISFHPRNP